MEDSRRPGSGGKAQGEVQFLVNPPEHHEISAIRYMGKIWVVPLPFLMLWAMPVRWGRPRSTRGGEFLAFLRALHRKSKSRGGTGEERWSSVATSVSRGQGSAPLLEPGRKSRSSHQECQPNRKGGCCSRPRWRWEGSSLGSCRGHMKGKGS